MNISSLFASSQGRRRLAGSLVLACGLLASCSQGASDASNSVATSAPATTLVTLAPSGDPVLDAMDSDLSAFEKESAEIDNAAVASQDAPK